MFRASFADQWSVLFCGLCLKMATVPMRPTLLILCFMAIALVTVVSFVFLTEAANAATTESLIVGSALSKKVFTTASDGMRGAVRQTATTQIMAFLHEVNTIFDIFQATVERYGTLDTPAKFEQLRMSLWILMKQTGIKFIVRYADGAELIMNFNANIRTVNVTERHLQTFEAALFNPETGDETGEFWPYTEATSPHPNCNTSCFPTACDYCFYWHNGKAVRFRNALSTRPDYKLAEAMVGRNYTQVYTFSKAMQASISLRPVRAYVSNGTFHGVMTMVLDLDTVQLRLRETVLPHGSRLVLLTPDGKLAGCSHGTHFRMLRDIPEGYRIPESAFEFITPDQSDDPVIRQLGQWILSEHDSFRGLPASTSTYENVSVCEFQPETVPLLCMALDPTGCTAPTRAQTCDDFCTAHGLQCSGAWDAPAGPCVKAGAARCSQVAAGGLVCQCAPQVVPYAVEITVLNHDSPSTPPDLRFPLTLIVAVPYSEFRRIDAEISDQTQQQTAELQRRQHFLLLLLALMIAFCLVALLLFTVVLLEPIERLRAVADMALSMQASERHLQITKFSMFTEIRRLQDVINKLMSVGSRHGPAVPGVPARQSLPGNHLAVEVDVRSPLLTNTYTLWVFRGSTMEEVHARCRQEIALPSHVKSSLLPEASRTASYLRALMEAPTTSLLKFELELGLSPRRAAWNACVICAGVLIGLVDLVTDCVFIVSLYRSPEKDVVLLGSLASISLGGMVLVNICTLAFYLQELYCSGPCRTWVQARPLLLHLLGPFLILEPNVLKLLSCMLCGMCLPSTRKMEYLLDWCSLLRLIVEDCPQLVLQLAVLRTDNHSALVWVTIISTATSIAAVLLWRLVHLWRVMMQPRAALQELGVEEVRSPTSWADPAAPGLAELRLSPASSHTLPVLDEDDKL